MSDRKTIKEIATLWQDEKKHYVKKSTYYAYALIVETHLLPFFGEKNTIEEADVQEFILAELGKGLNQKTVRDELVVLKMIAKFGSKKGYFSFTGFDITFPTNHEKGEIEVLTKAEQRKLTDYLTGNFNFFNLGILVCLRTGVRIGELCALTWDDIDLDRSIISITKTIQRIYVIEGEKRYTELIIDTPKTKSSIRDIPISKSLLRVLKLLKKVMNGKFYILTNDLKPTEPRTYRKYYNALMKELGLPPLKFHGLRHSMATRCIESNCDYKTVSTILGHSDISTTLNLYVHPNMEQKQKCIEQMDKNL